MAAAAVARASLLLSFALVLLAEISSARPQSSARLAGAQANGEALAAGQGGENIGCGFRGNPDVYGLGIRLGLYAQWLSTLISNWFHQANITRMRDVNTCFQLAMMIAMIALATNEAARPHALDLYIIIVQIVGSVRSSKSTASFGELC